MCRSTQQAPSTVGGDRRGDPRFVARVADRNAIALAHQRNRAEVQLLVVGRIGAAGVQQDQVVGAEHVDRVIDLLERAHARGEDDRLAGGSGVTQQVVVGQRGRRDLVARRREAVDEVDRLLVPARREPRDLAGAAVRVDLLVVVVVELEPALQVAVGRAERALSGLGQLLGRVDDVDRALLELDRIAPGGDGDADQPLGQVDVAVVVDADLGDHVARLSISDGPIADGDRPSGI